jgi:hypothetical protein
LLPAAARIVGAAELSPARAVALACRLDGQPVTLVIGGGGEGARSSGAPAAKRVAHRSDGGLRVATWTQDGRSYALVSPASVRAEAVCTLCHGPRAVL